MSFEQAPKHPVTADEAVGLVAAFLQERTEAGVMMAPALAELRFDDGVLTSVWNVDAIGQAKSDVLLEVNPFENLAQFLGSPMSFDNEEGRQIRQHVKAISVIGPFGVGTLTSAELYERGTGERVAKN